MCVCVCAPEGMRIRETKTDFGLFLSDVMREKAVIYHRMKLAAVVFVIMVYKFGKLLHCLLLKSDQIRLEMSKNRASALKPEM